MEKLPKAVPCARNEQNIWENNFGLTFLSIRKFWDVLQDNIWVLQQYCWVYHHYYEIGESLKYLTKEVKVNGGFLLRILFLEYNLKQVNKGTTGCKEKKT